VARAHPTLRREHFKEFPLSSFERTPELRYRTRGRGPE
jgi:hypothetical protein